MRAQYNEVFAPSTGFLKQHEAIHLMQAGTSLKTSVATDPGCRLTALLYILFSSKYRFNCFANIILASLL
jgi:hypothetical protein